MALIRRGINNILDRVGVPQDSKAHGTSTQPFIISRGQGHIPQWASTNYRAYVEEGFAQNAVIYASLMYKAKAIALSEVRAYEGSIDDRTLLDPTNPLQMLARRPNHFQSFTELMMLNTVYLNLAGNVFMAIDRDSAGSDIRAIYTLRPDRMRIVPSEDGAHVDYAYIPDGMSIDNAVIILAENMMHIKFPNPLDPLEGMGHGLSPMSAGARSADVDNLMTDFLNILFRSGMMPQSAITFDTSVDDDEAREIRDRIQREYGGSENWGLPLVMGAGAKYIPMTPTLRDMEFGALDGRNEKRILAPFGVPGMLIGFQMENSTFSNFDQAATDFWQTTMLPEQGLYADEFDSQISDPSSGEFLAFDNATIPALQDDINMQSQTYGTLVQWGIPPNEAARQAGLKIPEMEFGDISYLPIGHVPMGQVSEGIKEELADQAALEVDAASGELAVVDEDNKALPQVDEQQAVVWDFDYKQVLWFKTDEIAESWETRYKNEVFDLFERDRRKILALLTDFKKLAHSQKATPDWTGYLEAVDTYLSDVSVPMWGTEMTPLFLGVIEEQSEFWIAEMGINFQLRNIEGEAWFQDYVIQFAGDVSDTTSANIHSVIADTLATGESVETTSNRINLVFEQYMQGDVTPADFEWMTDRMPVYRTEMIARTETHNASQTGSHQLFKAADVEKKEWLATDDSRTRDSHLKAWSTYGGKRNAIPIDDPFIVGGVELLHPGDTNGEARETINCRCVELPVL